ncbi:hypothetical protein DFJ74DRAFT_434498 [Hyaloraphidium curvatum]|nr:hypothetical protein DFJ74DRAFT_434498 [Hyaloraphidium curvatum]
MCHEDEVELSFRAETVAPSEKYPWHPEFRTASRHLLSRGDEVIVFDNLFQEVSANVWSKTSIALECQLEAHPLSPTRAETLLVTGILDRVASMLSLLDVAVLGRVSRRFHAELDDHLSRRITRALAKYVPDPKRFCDELRAHGAIVGGSTALSIVRPGKWAPGDLDVVVPKMTSKHFESYLECLGYEVFEEHTPSYFMDDDIYEDGPVQAYIERKIHEAGQFKHTKWRKKGTKGSATIDLCVPREMTATAFVLTYHVSCVMNFFDGSRIRVLFPEHTFRALYVKNLFTPTLKVERAIEKYNGRGYQDMKRGEYLQDLWPRWPETLVASLPQVGWMARVPISKFS